MHEFSNFKDFDFVGTQNAVIRTGTQRSFPLQFVYFEILLSLRIICNPVTEYKQSNKSPNVHFIEQIPI